MSSSQMQFTLPDLIALCPFPWSTSQHKGAAAESAAWVDSFNVFSDRKRAFFLQSYSELLVSHTYCDAGYDELRTCCDFVNLTFVIDEISDEQSGVGARETGDAFLRAMGEEPCDGSVVSRMTKDFKKRFLSKVGKNSHRRFLKHAADYIDAVAKEAELRERDEVLDLEAFKPLRRENSAVRLGFGLFEYVHGIDLPDEVFEDPVFMRLYWAACDMIWLSNDLYSYNMEQAKGISGINYITILMRTKNFTLQEACDHVGAYWGELMDQYLADKAQLRSWSPEVDAGVQRYLTSLDHWVIGYVVWCFDTQRYFGPQHYEIKATRLVTLKPLEVPADSI